MLADIMPGWKIHQNFVVPVLRAAGLDFSQVAYVNLLKWRATASSGIARLYALSWDHHTRKQLELLAPGHVVAIGTDAGRASKRHYNEWLALSSSRAYRQQLGPSGPGGIGRNRKDTTPSRPILTRRCHKTVLKLHWVRIDGHR